MISKLRKGHEDFDVPGAQRIDVNLLPGLLEPNPLSSLRGPETIIQSFGTLVGQPSTTAMAEPLTVSRRSLWLTSEIVMEQSRPGIWA